MGEALRGSPVDQASPVRGLIQGGTTASEEKVRSTAILGDDGLVANGPRGAAQMAMVQADPDRMLCTAPGSPLRSTSPIRFFSVERRKAH